MTHREEIYKNISNIQLKLHVFEPPTSASRTVRSCIVFFHGGGWKEGTPSQFYPQCQYFASRGMVAISAAYRLSGTHGTTPYECVSDAKSAIRWVRSHASQLNIDPHRLAAGGGSAGGHIATAAAIAKGFDDPADDLAISPKPGALVLFNPAIDNSPGHCGYESVKDYWRDFSPIHNITKGMPSAILFLGTKDNIISVDSARLFKKRMQDAGARCDLWLYKDQKHAFFNYQDGNNPYYNATVYEADRFLNSLGYLDGEPTLQSAFPPTV